MVGFTKVVIFLKDTANHEDYNRRILDYLKDRHQPINDNKFTIAIEVVDASNVNEYVLAGMESVPALRMQKDGAFIYGVNSILATLAKLEVIGAAGGSATAKKAAADAALQDSFYNMAMKEMASDEQEDDTIPSTVKAYRTETPETPITEKMIEEKTKAYTRIYEERQSRNGRRPARGSGGNPPSSAPTGMKRPTGEIDVDKLISTGGFDKGEAMLMRQMAGA
jgi:hypothetical protein